MKKIIKYVFADILRNKIVIFYTLFLLGLSLTVFNLEDNAAKGLISLLNVVLFTVPLICIIFSSIYVYNSSEFIELLVSQPLKRSSIWMSIYAGLTGSLSLAFFIGAGIPILIYAPSFAGIMMLLLGLVLTVVFISIAVLSSVTTRDKARGIGKAILLWLYFSILFDGLVLFLLFQLSDYPIEKGMLAVTALNPIDLARIVILLQMDISALMGYTGAIFRDVFGTFSGVIIAFLILLLWAIIPLFISVRKFNKKDL
jgi:Cu-processing system permease protein